VSQAVAVVGVEEISGDQWAPSRWSRNRPVPVRRRCIATRQQAAVVTLMILRRSRPVTLLVGHA
jgi:hypothetical protein